MINKKFNVAKEVRDCVNRNCGEGGYCTLAEGPIRRLVYKAYRIGCKEGRMIAARMPLNAGGVQDREVQRPASEAKQ